MHEFSITERLFELALAQADLRDGEHIERLHIELDPNSGYAPDAIRFYFEQLALGSSASGAELDFQMMPSSLQQPQQIRLTAIDVGEDDQKAESDLAAANHVIPENGKAPEYGQAPASLEREVVRWAITVKGSVQGVGFRPFVHRLADQLGVNGWVRNTSSGVLMEIQGKSQDLEHLCHHLQHDAPPPAHIHELEIAAVEPKHDASEIGIRILPNQCMDGRMA